MGDLLDTEIDLATGFVAIVLGTATLFTAYIARRRYYAGPWKSTAVWFTWGVALSLLRVTLTFLDELFTPSVNTFPEWVRYSITIFAFLCFMNAAFALRGMGDIYSSKGYKDFSAKFSSKK